MDEVVVSCRKGKKTLNMNEQASISMDCLHEDYDLQDRITREKYFELLDASRITDRVLNVVKNALEKANLTPDQLYAVECVGSSMRMTVIRDAIEKFVNKPLGSKMNAEEAVAIGCALYCARHSPAAKIRVYDLIEVSPVATTASWRTIGDPNDTKPSDPMEIFPINYSLPKAKSRNVTLYRTDAKPFEFSLSYNPPELVTFGSNHIATCKVAQILKSDQMIHDVKLVVKVKAEPIGTFHITEVEMLEEREDIVEVPIEEEKKEEKPGEKKEGEKSEEKKDGEATKSTEESKTEESNSMAVEPETPKPDEQPKPKTRQEKKKVIISTKIPHQIITPNELTEDQITQFKKLEAEMTNQDELIFKTAHVKNELETYVYSATENVSGKWQPFATKDEKNQLEELCGQITIWLYDEGADVPKSEYDSRLKSVKDLAEKLNIRHREWDEVPQAIEVLKRSIENLRALATSKDEAYSHIVDDEMKKVIQYCDDAALFLESKMDAMKKLQKTNDPVFLSADLKMRNENLNQNCNKILNTPKPIPKKEEPKKEEKKEENKEEKENTTEKKDDKDKEGGPMDTEVD